MLMLKCLEWAVRRLYKQKTGFWIGFYENHKVQYIWNDAAGDLSSPIIEQGDQKDEPNQIRQMKNQLNFYSSHSRDIHFLHPIFCAANR